MNQLPFWSVVTSVPTLYSETTPVVLSRTIRVRPLLKPQICLFDQFIVLSNPREPDGEDLHRKWRHPLGAC
ncbi:MAG TPA: hypothetical protein VFX16_31880 [Pseudonocardiaceae bacterium]|nr:hypothetical protein [Pseudonocardiaceae bacterium]